MINRGSSNVLNIYNAIAIEELWKYDSVEITIIDVQTHENIKGLKGFLINIFKHSSLEYEPLFVVEINMKKHIHTITISGVCNICISRIILMEKIKF